MSQLTYYIAKITLTPDEAGLPTGVTNIGDLLTRIVGILATLVGLISVLAIIYGAIQMVTAAGDPGRIKTARTTITYAVVGVAVALLAGAIALFVANGLTK